MVRLLNKEDGQLIVAAIKEAEKLTSGEIRVHIQKKCSGDPMKDALKAFRLLKMHKTHLRNGAILWIAFESRQFTILGDQGIHQCVGDSFWSETRDKITSYFAKGQIKDGIIAGVMSIGDRLKTHFPVGAKDKNELSNKITGGQ